ncbi:hypothetical protein [Streptomyces sp. HPF1205]|uniref:hypothetical protein n=1 Tax=Streptomyces sp. HPF1205 TaxID=2873262 RepID=UPI001CEDF4D3|nr:hypothetical protein [Streptomyces sp. HPF1205]
MVSLLVAVIGLLGIVAQQTRSVWLLVLLVTVALVLVRVLWLALASHSRPRRVRRPRPGRRARPDHVMRSPRVSGFVDQVERAYQDGHGQREWLITAPLGYGKTSVLGALAARFRRRGALVAWVTVLTATGFATARTCLYLVEAIANDLREVDPDLDRQLKEAIARAQTRIFEETSVDFVLNELSETVSGVLSGAGRDVVLLVDDVHHILEPAAVEWLLALGRAVVAKRAGLVVLAAEEPLGQVTDRHLLPLGVISRAQGEAEAAWRLAGLGRQNRDRLPAVTDRIMKASGGMCFAFDWLCRQVAARGPAVLDTVVSDHLVDQPVAQAATAALDRLDEEAAAIAGVASLPLTDWLAVLDRFGGHYLATVLEEILEEQEGLTPQEAAAVVSWLREQDQEIQPYDDDLELGVRLVPFLQEFRRDRLRRQDPGRMESLRAVVERKYWGFIDADLDEPADVQLVAMLRFESPQWHALTLEWLDHAQGAGSMAAQDVSRSCAQLFLACYTWWDAFVPSSYCTQLLEEYERRWPAAAWVADLRAVRENFVPGSYSVRWRPANDLRRWVKAETALRSLAGHLGLSPGAEAGHGLHGLIALLRGAVCRFQGLHDEAFRWFGVARETIRESWMTPWIDYQVAETYYENGQFARARELIESVERRVAEIHDNDMTILVAQMLSDLEWAEGRPDRSVAYAVRAVLWAHAYHLQQETDGVTKPSTPNAYTRQRHEEAHQRLMRRLDQLGRPARAAANEQIAALFAPYWDRVRLTRPVRGEILPPRPTHADTLQGSESDYFNDIRALYFDPALLPPRTLSTRLAEPLGAPLTGETAVPSGGNPLRP